MLRHFFDVPEDGFSATPNNKNQKKAQKPTTHNGLEALEERKLLSGSPIDNLDDQAIIVNIHGENEEAVVPQQNDQLIDGEVEINISEYNVEVTTVTMPPAIVTGSLTKGSMRVTITNDSNETPSASDRVNISVFVRSVDAEDDSDDILVGSVANQTLNIGLDKSRFYNISLTLDTDLPEGEYEYVVIATTTEDANVGQTAADQSLIAADAFVDLSATVNDSSFPAETISGNGARIRMPITITNNGNTALSSTQKVDITIVARPAEAEDSDDDVQITVLTNQNVGNLRPGLTKLINAQFTLPAGMENGDYVLVAIIDSGDGVEESNEDNNEAVSNTAIDITGGFVNLAAELDDSRIAAAIVEGSTPRLTIPVTITNDGNINLAVGQKIQITIVARPVDAQDSDDDVEMIVLENQSVSNLRAGQSKRLNATFNLPADLNADDYNFIAIVDSNNDVEESNEDDNEAVGATDIEVAEAYVNLAGSINSSRFPESTISGDGTRILVPVTITNNGNVALATGQTVNIYLAAELADNIDAENQPQDVPFFELSEVENQNVSRLAAGASRTFNVYVTLPAGMPSEDYVIVGAVQANGDIDESTGDDNEFVSDASIAVTEGVYNLTAAINESRLQEALISGNGDRITVPVTVTNNGNIALERGQTISISLHAQDSNNNSADMIELTILETASVSGLAVGASRTFNLLATLPAGMDSADYSIIAVVDSNDDIEESDEDDNVAVSEASIDVTQGVVNLNATIDESRLQEALTSGNGDRITLPITITNDGNIALARNQTVDITIVARPAEAEDSDDDIEVAVLADQSVSALAAGKTKRLNAQFNLPVGLEGGNYVLVAIVDSNDDVEESDENDNEAVGETVIDVTEGVRDLTVALNDSRLQEALISGNGDRILMPITITNDGNIALATGQTVNITLYARPADAQDSDDDVEITVLENQSVSALRAGQSKLINAQFSLPVTLETDEYVIVAVVDSGDDVQESDEENNEAVSEATVDITQGAVNLSAVIDDSRLQEALTSGNGDRIILPITITNDGNIALNRTQKVDITIVARPADAQDSDDDVEITVLTGQNVGGLGAGLSRKINATVNLPVGLESDDYVLVAIIDSNDDVQESDEDDNEAATGAAIAVTKGFVNLTANLNDSRIATAIVEGTTPRLTIPVTINNEGNVNLAAGQKIQVTIVARPVDAEGSDDDVEMVVLVNQNVSGLRAGTSRTINAVFNLPADLDADDYNFVAIIDSNDDVEESDEDDNEAIGGTDINVAPAFVNLTATVDGSRLPEATISGNGKRFIVPVTVTNSGNVAIERGQKINISMHASDTDESYDLIDLEVFENANISGLAAGASRTFNVAVTLPAGMRSENYVILAVVDSDDIVDESNENDNEAITDAVIDVTKGAANLTAVIDDSRLQEALISGNGDRILLPITITNAGNISLDRTQRIDITIVARPADAQDRNDDIEITVLTNQNVGNLGVGLSRKINASIELPAGLDSDEYVLVAVIDSGHDVIESNDEDNDAVTQATIDVTKGVVNLSGTIDDSRYQAALISGRGDVVLIPVIVSNDGNIALERTQKIDITIVLRPADAENSDDDVELTVLTAQNVGGLGAGLSRRINAYVTLPDGLETDDYQVIAIIDSSDVVEESDEDDNEAVGDQLIAVTQGVRDLSVELDDSRIPEAAVTGSNTRFILPVTITNNGNLKLAPGQKVQITVEAVRANAPGGVGINIPDETITVLTFDNANLSNLAAGQSRVINLAFTLPLDDAFVDGEDYSFRVTVDTGDAIDESDEDNNEAETEAAVTVTRGGPNLTVDIDETDIPTEAISGDESTIMVPVTVTNDGVARMPAGQTVDINIYIMDTDEENEPVLLTTLVDQNISLLQIGQSKTFIASVTLLGDLESANHRLFAVVDPANLIVETDEEDNADFATGTIDVTQGSRDLSVEITEEDLEDFLVDTNGNATITVTLTNAGNLSTAVDATTQVAIFARLVGAEDGENDVYLGQDESVDIGALAADESVEVTFTDLDLSDLGVGEYVLVARVNDAGLLNAEFENSVTETMGTIEVTLNSNDLSISLIDTASSDFVEGQIGAGNELTIVLTNNGTTAIPEDTTVTVVVSAFPIGEGQPILVQINENVDISELAPEGTIQVTFEDWDLSELPAGQYNLLANVYDSELDLASEGNNSAVVETSFTVSPAFDIAASLQDYDSNSFPESLNNPALNTITTRLTNNSGTAIADETLVTLNVYARPTGGGEDVLVKENVIADISLLAPDAFVDVVVDDMDLSGLPGGEYTLISITDDSALAGASGDNNEVSTNDSFDVVPN